MRLGLHISESQFIPAATGRSIPPSGRGTTKPVFLSESKYRKLLVKQENAAVGVNAEQARRIVSGKLDPLGNLNSKFPKSAVIGIELADDDNGTFTERKAVPISIAVAEKLAHILSSHSDALE